MRVIFLGSGEFGLPTLRSLVDAHDVPMVISQPDRPAGRRRAMTPTPIAAWAESAGIHTTRLDNVNAPEVIERLGSLSPDAIVVVAFGQYIKQALTEIPRFGAMNLHASLLPRWRGASPINSAVLAGDRQTGNTVIRLAKKMDAGAMLGRQRTVIDPRETAGELHDRLAALGPELVLDVLAQLDRGEASETEQDEAAVTLAPKLSREDGYVDFDGSADAVRCRVHGLPPWPGVTAYWSAHADGDRKPIKLCRVEGLSDPRHNKVAGQLLDETGVVACGSGAVRLLEVQPPGKRVMSFTDFANGHDLHPGAVFHRGL